MKKLSNFLIIGILLLIGCSPQSQFEDPISTSTIAPQVTRTQISAATNHNIDVTHTASQSAATEENTPTPSFQAGPSYKVAGIESKRTNDISMIAEAGMAWTRINALQWPLIEPELGDRRWEEVETLEQELVQASELGLETILIVRGTPDWAQKVGGVPCGPIEEDYLMYFGEFLYDAVIRYSQPPYNVQYWELGNEPDVDTISANPNSAWGCWGDSRDEHYGGGYYAEMLKIVYPRIKDADDDAQVVIGGLLLDCDPIVPPEFPPGSGTFKDCKPATFLEGVLRNGGGEYFDGVAFHAYDYYYNHPGQFGNINWHSSWDTTGPVIEAKLRYLKELLKRYGYEDKYYLNTEGALLCGRDGKESECLTDTFNNTKASYIAQTFTLARVLDLRVNIWYNLHGWRGSGLLDGDGNPLPAFEALIFNTSILENTHFQERIDEFNGITGFTFINQSSEIWVIWSQIDGEQKIQTQEQPDIIYDIYGNKINLGEDISVDSSPLYLIWSLGP